MRKTDTSKSLARETQLVLAGRNYSEHGIVNPAVYRASTIIFPDMQALRDLDQPYHYGRKGTPTSRAFEDAVAQLEGGFASKAAPSGLMAITAALLAFLKAGDHILVTDAVYHPVRVLCEGKLRDLGVETTYYDPRVGAEVASLIRPATRILYCEAPGSQTMEVSDIPLLADLAHDRGVLCFMDNTWSAGHLFKPFKHGVDVSVQAATKYIVGHADAMLGVVTCNEECWPQFILMAESMGLFAGPDDMYLALRGMRTLDVRLERHMKNGIAIAEWLKLQPEVKKVLHPALPDDAGHAIWTRDFLGASGLFSVIMHPLAETALDAFLNNLELIAMGASWGGYESLVMPFRPTRTVARWADNEPGLRFHIGLENSEDLIADLSRGFTAMRHA